MSRIDSRPNTTQGYAKSGSDGSWFCPSCSNRNFAKRTRCNKCGIPKPEAVPPPVADPVVPVPPPEGSADFHNALFKKGDWPCPACGNINWARRDRCNMCNTPKPSIHKDSAEQRTGRAGGHFDLQDPLDREEHDSDNEEFDEFGRKKKSVSRIKRSSPVNQSASPITHLAAHRENESSGSAIALVFPKAPRYISESEDEDEPSGSRRTGNILESVQSHESRRAVRSLLTA